MKFDPPIPFLAPPAAGPEHAIRFTLEQGAFAGRAFTGTLYICPNPCCPCQTLRFCCQPDQEPGGLEPVAPADPPGPLRFELRVLRRALDPEAEMPPESLALARAVVAELQPADWEQWLRVFLATKRGQMATMDLDGPDAWLPPEIMDGSATMVGYVEVFPWAEELRFPLAGDTWEADDQYCVDPDCDCQTTILTFIRVPRNAKRQSRPVRSESVLRHDYVTGKTKVEERRFWGPEATEVMAALRAAHPGCDLTFRERHRQMKRIAERLVPAVVRNSRRGSGFRMKAVVDDVPSTSPAPPPKPAVKPGRNDPCPCGSGKKYKKCCGR